MSGLLRNLVTLVLALFQRGSVQPHGVATAWFRVTPLDTGLLTLKSDKYFQLAESAQVDFLIKAGLAGRMRAERCSFVNAAQMVRFARPVRLFSRVRVDTRVLYADGKCAWFSHAFSVAGVACAEVLVKMKFKRGRETVPPELVLGAFRGARPASVLHWDEALAAS
ncbi:MAG: thioesterase family protein [Burkholderiales bacterium]|nr:thioesterase family protein [Burkholderiales bacterium]